MSVQEPVDADAPELALAFVRDPRQARSLLDPLRRTILDRLAEPGSASSVARALGLPRQRVNYHVRELEEEGLLRHVGDRRRGNCVERVVRASARRYLVDPAVVGIPHPSGTPSDAPPNPFSADDLLLTAARSLGEVGTLREDSLAAGKRIPTLTLETRIRFGSPRDEVEFAQAVHEVFTRLTERYDRPDAPSGRTFRINLTGHPVPPPSGGAAGGEEP